MDFFAVSDRTEYVVVDVFHTNVTGPSNKKLA